jgi:tetratricopeptide (TPR) repeat protein
VISRPNFRFLAWTFVLLLVGAGGAFGAIWYRNRPDFLYSSAEKYFNKGEDALNAKDYEAAKTNYESADKQLQNLLDKDREESTRKANLYFRGLLLRSKTLNKRSLIAQQTDPGEANKLSTEAQVAAFAAAQDPRLYEAQKVALDYCFPSDFDQFLRSLPRATVYADNVIKNKQENEDDRDLAKYLQGAYYILAVRDVTANPPRPDAVLNQMLESRKVQERYAKGDPPKWRAFSLEVEARKQKLALATDTLKTIRLPSTAQRQEVEKLKDELRTQIDQGLVRVKQELRDKVPASDDQPERPALSQLSLTDAHGLSMFLQRAVRESTGQREAVDTANLALDACTAMTEKGARPSALKEGAACAASLPGLLTHLGDNRPFPADMESIKKTAEDLAVRAGKSDVGVSPETYLQMGQDARTAKKFDLALEHLTAGLKAAKDQRRPEKSETVLKLHTEMAYLLLFTKKPTEAEEHLKLLQGTTFAPKAHLIQGLVAVLDGRLELGVNELNRARENPNLTDSFYAHLGLAYGYMGQGKYADALTSLKKLEEYYKKFNEMGPEERGLAEALLPSPSALQLEMVRCNLALSLTEKTPAASGARLAEALKYREALKDKPEAAAADALLIGAYLNASALARQANKEEEANAAYANARKLLESARAAYRDDPTLLSLEVSMVLSEPSTVPGPALVLGSPVNRSTLLRISKADKVIHDYAFARESFAGIVAWERWLQSTGRLDEAGDVLSRMEKDFPDKKRAIQLERVPLYLRLRQTGQLDKIAKEFHDVKDNDPAATFIELVKSMGDAKGPESVDAASRLNKAENNGRLQFLHAQLCQVNGDFAEAARSFAKAMQFTSVRSRSQAGLLISLLSLAERGSPSQAADVVEELRKKHADEPALLLADAEIQRLLDNLTGEKGMEGALQAMKAALKKQNPSSPAGPYLAALSWNSAGRPDRARAEVNAALEINKKHLGSLVLKGQMALGDEDWDTCLKVAAALDEIQPNILEALLWRAAAYVGKGETAKAEKIYKELVDKSPNLSGGYMGQVALHERAKEYGEALKALAPWRKLAPHDRDALRRNVALLVLSGKPDEAEKLGEAFVEGEVKEVEKQFNDEEKKRKEREESDKDKKPLTEEEKARWERSKADSRFATEVVSVLAVASGYQDAKKFEKAQKWIDRVYGLVEKRHKETTDEVNQRLAEARKKDPNAVMSPEDKARKASADNNLQIVQLLLASNYLERAKDEKDPARHKADIDKAIELYQKIYKDTPRHFVAGNNLAWLLTKERNEPKAARAIIAELRKGRFSDKNVSGARLPLEFLDTLGVVYRATKDSEDASSALEVFKDAAESRYADNPRVLIHLGQSYASVGKNKEASETLTAGIKLAQRRLKETEDPERKAKLNQLINEAEAERAKVNAGGRS